MNFEGQDDAAPEDTVIAWDITTAVTGLEGTTDDNNSWTVSIL